MLGTHAMKGLAALVGAVGAVAAVALLAPALTFAAGTLPTIACPAPIQAEATGNLSASVNVPAATATGDGVVVTGPSGTNTYPLGTTSIAFTATDSAGNAVSCSSSVTVLDTTPPTISCPAPITAEATGNASAFVVPGAATASDIAGPVTVANPPGGSFPLGTTTVTHTATDASGNTSSCTSTISVVDTTPPTITCPAPITAEATGNQQAIVNVPSATASDVATSVTVSGPSGTNAYPLGTTLIAFTAKDQSNNSASCATSVTVVDTTAPTIACPANISVTAGAGGTAVVTYAASASDTDGPVTIGYSLTPGSTFAVGTTTVTATATDLVSNTASCTFAVTVTNITPTTLCQLTKQYVESSAKFQALTNSQRAAVDTLANALCAKLAQIVPTLTPAQKASLISAYKIGVQALVPSGWLTQTQASELKSLADTL